MKHVDSTNIPLSHLIKSTLSTRLSLALIIIVILSSYATLLAGQHWMQRYNEEVTQKLNASIAMYITGAYELLKKADAKPNPEAIKKLSQQAMIINPIAEVYLLDTQGKIVAHALPDQVHTDTVSLIPINAFLSGKQPYPLHGTDPRNPNEGQIFSVAEIKNGESLQGYLYVVLGSKLHQEISNTAKSSRSRSMAVMSIIMIALVTTLSGLVIFRLLIKPLRELSRQIRSFSCNQLNKNPGIHDKPSNNAERKESGNRSNPCITESHCNDLSHRDEIKQLGDVFNDMSHQLDQQLSLLKESDKARRELVANISHDLRTPLSSIQGYLETLIIKDGDISDSERLLYLKRATNSSNRLCQLIGDLFELSKLDSPSAQPNFESFSLVELAYDTLQELEIDLTQKGIHYEVKAPNSNLNVYADISLIQRVFENLIRNAITYTPNNGTIILHIESEPSSALDSINISITDSGRGIDQEELPHIFDRFYTNPNNSREGINSTGLGLAIVKRILELHNTPIKVQSKIHEGTRFEFSLPNAIQELTPV